MIEITDEERKKVAEVLQEYLAEEEEWLDKREVRYEDSGELIKGLSLKLEYLSDYRNDIERDLCSCARIDILRDIVLRMKRGSLYKFLGGKKCLTKK